MKIIPMPAPRKGQSCICVECSQMIYADRETILCDLDGVPFKAYYHDKCLPVNGFLWWQYIEERGGYFFWKYEDKDGRTVYQCTKEPKPPMNDAGYYSYGYLLKVKGIIKGETLNSIFKEL